MASYNRVAIVGRLGADPESRSFSNGGKVVNLRVAVSETWTKDGERKERTDWFAVAITNERLADVAEKYLRKGSNVLLEGKLQNREWNDKDGNKRTSTEIILGRFNGELQLLDKRDAGDAPSQAPRAAQPARAPAGGWMGRGMDDEDQIPF